MNASGCFWWLTESWTSCLIHTIIFAGIRSTLTNSVGYMPGRRPTQVRGTRRGAGCSVKLQIVWPHILPRCSALAQSKKLSRHVSALKVPFSEMLHDLGPVDGSPRPPSSTGWQGTHGNFLAAFFGPLPYFYLFPLFVYS